MTRLLIVLLIGLCFEASGVVCLSRGLKQIGEAREISAPEIWRVFKAGAGNTNILLGVMQEAIFFGTLLYLMSQGSVSFVWPLTSLGFVLTTVAAKLLLREEVSVLRWSGVLLIVLGAGLITYSEKVLEARHATPPPAGSSAPAGQ